MWDEGVPVITFEKVLFCWKNIGEAWLLLLQTCKQHFLVCAGHVAAGAVRSYLHGHTGLLGQLACWVICSSESWRPSTADAIALTCEMGKF